jgi:hypothetical protein
MGILNRVFTGLVVFSAMACSTAQVRVLPGEDGIHKVVSRDIERDGAESEAVKKAENFCEDRDKAMAVVKEENTKYTGSMNEETRNTIRKGSKVAGVLGSQSEPGNDIGNILGSAGTAGTIMTNDRDYMYEFTFKCI